MTTAEAEPIRHRSRTLRRLGNLAGATEAADLVRRVGPEMWSGPSADRCFDDLTAVRRVLLGVHDHLLAAAAALDREADRVEALPPVTGPP